MNRRTKMMLALRGLMDEAGDGTGGAGDGGAGNAGEGDKGAGNKTGDASGDKGDTGHKKPTDEEARLLKENMQKKEQLRKAQADLEAFKKQFEGIDPEAVRKMLADQKDAETKALEAKGDYDRLKARMAEEHGKEVKTLADKLAELEAKLSSKDGEINELTIGSAFNQSKFISDELVLPSSKARMLYASHFDLVDGKIVGYDKPRGSSARTALVDGSGEPISFDAAIRAIVESDPEKDSLIRSKAKPGAGSSSGKPNGEIRKDTTPADPVSRIAAGLSKMNQGRK